MVSIALLFEKFYTFFIDTHVINNNITVATVIMAFTILNLPRDHEIAQFRLRAPLVRKWP